MGAASNSSAAANTSAQPAFFSVRAYVRKDGVIEYTAQSKEIKLTTMRDKCILTVQNVVTLTRYTGVDPEVFGGIDSNIYPRPRNYVMGLKFNF